MAEQIGTDHGLDLFGSCSFPQAAVSCFYDDISENVAKQALHETSTYSSGTSWLPDSFLIEPLLFQSNINSIPPAGYFSGSAFFLVGRYRKGCFRQSTAGNCAGIGVRTTS